MLTRMFLSRQSFIPIVCLTLACFARASDSTIIAEAEQFSITDDAKPETGWHAKKWGENYYCATFGDTFLSRKAFLGAPEQCPDSSAVMTLKIPSAGRYLALARYEA